jgi:hypothetical protein
VSDADADAAVDAAAELTDEIATPIAPPAERAATAGPPRSGPPPSGRFPAARRHSGLRRRGLAHWLTASIGFGMSAGPLIALVFNHGRPQPMVVAIVSAPLAVLAASFVATGVFFMHWTWRASLWRAVVVLLVGSVVFLLPNAVNPPATGDFWWSTVLEKYAVSCLPYPFIGWLVMPGIRRRLAVEVCTLLAAGMALGWPVLLRAMQDQTADVLRRELALPPSMLYVLDMPGAKTVHGYRYDEPAVSLGYRLPGSGPAITAGSPDLGYDVDIVVFPAARPSPCAELPAILASVDGFSRQGMSCARTAAGLWRAADDGTFEALDDATEVELVDGEYVAVTVGRQSGQFDGEFAVLFADLRHPTSAQLVQVGLAGGPSPLE